MASAPAGPRELWTALRRAFREAVRFDRSAFSLVVGARVALGVVIALVIGKAFGDPAAEASMAAGALLAGVSGAVLAGRTPLRVVGTVAVAMAISTFVGSASGELGWVHTATLVPWCLAAGLLVGVGGAAATIGTQSLTAMIVFGRFAEQPVVALHLAGFVLAGGVIAVVVLGLTRSPVTSSLQRATLASGLVTLGELAAGGPAGRRGVASAEALEVAEGLLSKAVRFDVDESMRLRSVLDVARRSRLEILAIEGLSRRLFGRGEETTGEVLVQVEEALTATGTALCALAVMLTKGAASAAAADVAKAEEATQQARRSLRYGECLERAASEAIDAHLAALAGQVRAGYELVGQEQRHTALRRVSFGALLSGRFGSPAAGIGETFDILRAHASVRSPIGRHALRLTIVVSAAEVLALHAPVQRGYWVALTAALVLRPDFSITFSRGLARMIGTSVGVVLAGLLVIGIQTNALAEIVAIGILCTLACATFAVGYALFTGFLTGLVVLLVGIVTPGTFALALDRLADTFIGGALALVAYGLWPTWSRQRAPQALAGLVARQRSYLAAVLDVAAGVRPFDLERLRRLARGSRQAKAEADDAVVRALEEPERRRFSPTQGQGILAALTRISLATHALRVDLEDGRPAAVVPEMRPFAAALSGALGRASDRLGLLARIGPDGTWEPEDGKAPIPLRLNHEEFTAAVGDRTDVGPLLAGTAELVDAVDTLDALLVSGVERSDA